MLKAKSDAAIRIPVAENTWASAPDGQRFVLGAPENLHEGYPINLIANWAGKR